MSDADKRKVSTDALETLGSIIDEREKRDAIHLAVAPVKAQEKLFPGQDVGVDGTTHNPVGIVDPFLKSPVYPGQIFWLVIYPRQINSLRHVWSHPAFEDEIKELSPHVDSNLIDPIEESKKWIDTYSASVGAGYSYEEVMQYADECVESSRKGGFHDYLTGADEMQGESTSEKFWDHYEIVRGIKLKDEEKRKFNFFSCSC